MRVLATRKLAYKDSIVEEGTVIQLDRPEDIKPYEDGYKHIKQVDEKTGHVTWMKTDELQEKGAMRVVPDETPLGRIDAQGTEFPEPPKIYGTAREVFEAEEKRKNVIPTKTGTPMAMPSLESAVIPAENVPSGPKPPKKKAAEV